jgi:tRNA-Thr(GGU) m(6)t(6)A37 methyltransferase TsaA
MAERSDVRPGEVAIELPTAYDASVYFIGRIRTPFKSRAECPRNTAESHAVGRVELDPRFAAGLEELGLYSHVWLLYWMDQARRDLIQQVPAHLGHPRGTFALRSPVRPNPIALAAVELLGIDGTTLSVRKIDCIDGTPLLDIKPYFASTDSFPDARRP